MAPTPKSKSIADQLEELQRTVQQLIQQQNVGGAAPQQSQQSMSITPSVGTAYFPSNFALVKVVDQGGYDSNVVWLVDVPNKTMRPFESTRALERVYGMPYEQLQSSINMVGGDSFTPGGVLNGFQLLDYDYAIKPDGTARALDYSAVTLAGRYGSGVNEAAEMRAYQGLDGFLSLLKKSGDLSNKQLSKVLSDKNSMAFYISALAYGGYSLSDIYSDIKAKELGINNAVVISPTDTRQEYSRTQAYRNAVNNPRLEPPERISGLDSSVLKLPIFDVPDDAFKKLTPILDPDSDAFKDAMDEAASVIYESQLQMLEANTEQDRAAAQALWNRNKSLLERKLGITLSTDAIEAWNQIENYQTTAAENGISGSGIMNKQIDDYLRDARRRSDINRESTLSDKEQQDLEYYLKYASPSEIAALPEEFRRKWGFQPDQETLNYFSMDNLKKMFPDEDEEQLKRLRDQYIDPNGNLYSSLYNTYSQNRYKTQGDYDSWKGQYVMSNALLDEEEAYAKYSQPDSPFLRGGIDESDLSKVSGKKKKGSSNTVDLSRSASSALGNLMNRNSAPQAPTVAPPRTNATVTPPKSVLPPTPRPTPAPAPAPTPTFSAKPQSTIASNPALAGGKFTLPTSATPPAYKPATASPYLTGQGSGGTNILKSAADWVSGLFGRKK